VVVEYSLVLRVSICHITTVVTSREAASIAMGVLKDICTLYFAGVIHHSNVRRTSQALSPHSQSASLPPTLRHGMHIAQFPILESKLV